MEKLDSFWVIKLTASLVREDVDVGGARVLLELLHLQGGDVTQLYGAAVRQRPPEFGPAPSLEELFEGAVPAPLQPKRPIPHPPPKGTKVEWTRRYCYRCEENVACWKPSFWDAESVVEAGLATVFTLGLALLAVPQIKKHHAQEAYTCAECGAALGGG